MSDEVTLTYSGTRGLATPIRMALVVAGIQFKDVWLRDRDHYLQLCSEGQLLFDQTPLLEIDGLKLVQMRACLHYVARKAGMLGRTDAEEAKSMMLFEGTRDFLVPLAGIKFRHTEEEGKELARSKIFGKYFPIYNKVLAESGTGYLVGPSMTVADIGLFEVLMYVMDYFNEDVLDPTPQVKEFYKQMCNHERISFYLKNTACPKITDETVDSLKKIYSHLI